MLTKSAYFTPPHNVIGCGGHTFSKTCLLILVTASKLFLVEDMDIADPGTTGSLIISMCTHSRHISKFDGASFLAIFLNFDFENIYLPILSSLGHKTMQNSSQTAN